MILKIEYCAAGGRKPYRVVPAQVQYDSWRTLKRFRVFEDAVAWIDNYEAEVQRQKWVEVRR